MKLVSLSLTLIFVCAIDHLQSSPIVDKDGCYKDLGCFNNGIMKHTGYLPQSPEFIQTKFFAYNRNNRENPRLIDPYDPKTFDIIDKNKQVVFITHGWRQSSGEAVLQSIKDSLLEFKSDEVGTVIMVDWRRGSLILQYKQSAANTELVGRQIGHLCNQIHKSLDFDVKKFYLIGFSLGAQVSGHAGKWTRSEYNWKFGRITGLDSAGPSFEFYEGAHLSKDDALLVDAIHTSIGGVVLDGELGMTNPYAHLDFYPNGGLVRQPKCHFVSGFTCSHKSAAFYYEASLSAADECQFNARKCDNYEDFENDKCESDITTVLGYDAQKTYKKNGNYYLKTSSEYPFCNVKRTELILLTNSNLIE